MTWIIACSLSVLTPPAVEQSAEMQSALELSSQQHSYAVTSGHAAPVIEYISPATAVSYVSPAPIVECIAPVPAVYAASAPVEYIAPVPAVTTRISSHPPVVKELPPTTVQSGRMEIYGQVAPVFLGTTPPVAGVGAPQVMAPPPTTAVEVTQGPAEYVQGATVTVRDFQIYTAPAASAPQVVSIALASAVVLPTVAAQKPQVTTAATVYQEGTVTYTAPALAVRGKVLVRCANEYPWEIEGYWL